LILLSLGTHHQPFDRAVDLLEPLARDHGEKLIIQHGATPARPSVPNVTWVEFMGFEKIAEIMNEADSVVCHAGVGTIMSALKRGHTPVVIPRLASFGEHVDDHQLDIAMRLAERGLVRCVTTQTDLTPLLCPRAIDPDRQMGRGSNQLRELVSAAVANESSHHRHLAFWH
jgi:UDP-N-acetylglucosamine transferase subunit ALG13